MKLHISNDTEDVLLQIIAHTAFFCQSSTELLPLVTGKMWPS